ncbi:MAG TPA: LPS assembly protein LptD, partial [Rhizobiaceae bacterium]|nr:LPS assembly protein LptD [Rhizobiaceae bacterium]
MRGRLNRIGPARGALLLAGASVLVMACFPAAAQQALDSVSGFTEPRKDAQLFLEANELVYDNDKETVSAVGDVRIEYDGIRLVARKIVYDQKSRRLKAYGNVEIVQPDKTRVYADEIDITDDFRTGFVNTLRVVTKEDARFAAESAERVDGEVTTFNQGVYTACEPCRENPDKAPVWQIKASRIIWNGKTKVIRYENASFEFLGIPLARLPVFEQADPGRKRKTGFLIPRPKYASKLGYGVGLPFFWNMAPNYDLTLEGTYYSKQGFLMEAEFRHRLHNGSYNLKIAGISQQARDEFAAGTNDAVNTQRGMIGTKGDFNLNSRWNFGWDLLVQSDPNFANTYGINGFTSTRHNTIYLAGLNDRNYFDLR